MITQKSYIGNIFFSKCSKENTPGVRRTHPLMTESTIAAQRFPSIEMRNLNVKYNSFDTFHF